MLKELDIQTSSYLKGPSLKIKEKAIIIEKKNASNILYM